MSQKSTERYHEQVAINEQYQPDNYLASQTSPLKYPIFNSVFSGELREPCLTLQLNKIKDGHAENNKDFFASNQKEDFKSLNSQNRQGQDNYRISTARGTQRQNEHPLVKPYELNLMSERKDFQK